jgi:hypothetical protein
MLVNKSPSKGGGAIIKDLIPWCGGEGFKSSHFQPKLPWLPN